MAAQPTLKRKSKDSVFVKFFQDKKNILQLYQEFHPEASGLNVDDITVQTLDSVMVNTIYNDLGFLVKDKFVMLVEAQSTWNPNIALRMLIYLVETFTRYLKSTDQSEHSSIKVKLPKPELYVFYSGTGEKPKVISLNDEFFEGTADIDVKVKVLSKVDTTLSGQYIGFCKVFDEIRKNGKDGVEIAKETFRICIEKGYLVDFMKAHEMEVIDMMTQLFDEEEIRKRYDIAERKNQATQFALKMLSRGKLTNEEIAEDSGLTLREVEALAKNMKPVNA